MTPSPEVLLAAGPALLFLMAFAETSMPLGLLVPAGVALSLGAFLAHEGVLAWTPVLVASGTGALAGDSTGFWLGRRGAAGFGRLPGRVGRAFRDSATTAVRLRRSSPLFSVTLARTASFVRTLMPTAVGMSGMRYPRFLVHDIGGVGLWLLLYVGIGVLAGESWRVVSGFIGTGWALLILAGAGVSWALARRGRPGLP